jgi:serine/threonine-protein phosphatase 2A regulatory subunit B
MQLISFPSRIDLIAYQVCAGSKKKKDEVNVESLDYNRKILHTAWHPSENIIAVAATNNLFLFQEKV